jgi:hypothetical protein
MKGTCAKNTGKNTGYLEVQVLLFLHMPTRGAVGMLDLLVPRGRLRQAYAYVGFVGLKVTHRFITVMERRNRKRQRKSSEAAQKKIKRCRLKQVKVVPLNGILEPTYLVQCGDLLTLHTPLPIVLISIIVEYNRFQEQFSRLQGVLEVERQEGKEIPYRLQSWFHEFAWDSVDFNKEEFLSKWERKFADMFAPEHLEQFTDSITIYEKDENHELLPLRCLSSFVAEIQKLLTLSNLKWSAKCGVTWANQRNSQCFFHQHSGRFNFLPIRSMNQEDMRDILGFWAFDLVKEVHGLHLFMRSFHKRNLIQGKLLAYVLASLEGEEAVQVVHDYFVSVQDDRGYSIIDNRFNASFPVVEYLLLKNPGYQRFVDRLQQWFHENWCYPRNPFHPVPLATSEFRKFFYASLERYFERNRNEPIYLRRVSNSQSLWCRNVNLNKASV